jgi:hypothetical protein
MKLLERKSWAGVLALGMLLGSSLARADKFGTDENGVEIVLTPFSQTNQASQGTAVTPMVIRNLDARRPATIEIGSMQGSFGMRLSRSFTVPAGAQINVPWLTPIDFMKNNRYNSFGIPSSFEVRVNGKTYDNALIINAAGGHYGYGGRCPNVVLCSRGANRDVLKSLMLDPATAAAATSSSSGGRSYGGSSAPEFEFTQSEAEPENWPVLWMAYSAFDMVVLTKAELERLPDAARNQLVAYVETGGWVMVLGGDKLPKGWENATVPSPSATGAKAGVQTVPIGFGTWTLAPTVPETKPAVTPTPFGSWLFEQLSRNTRAAHFATNGSWNNASFRVVDKVRIPVVGIMICIFIFAMLAGPLNILVLDRLKRRVWLLWTTPVLALLFSGILVAYFLFSEGLARHALYQEVSLLNEPVKRVSVLGMNAYYCPLPPDSLQYNPETEVRVLDARERFSGRLDMTRGTRLYSEWISPRIPANFSVRTSRTALERLQFSRRDDRLVVMNGLGKPIRHLVVSDGHRQLWKADQVKPGGTAELSRCGDPAINKSGTLTQFFLDGIWRQDLGEPLPTRPVPTWDWLGTSCHYVAEMEDSTIFLEKGASASDTKIKNVLILGVAADREVLEGN